MACDIEKWTTELHGSDTSMTFSSWNDLCDGSNSPTFSVFRCCSGSSLPYTHDTPDTSRSLAGGGAADLRAATLARTSAVTSLDSSRPATSAAAISMVNTATQLRPEM